METGIRRYKWVSRHRKPPVSCKWRFELLLHIYQRNVTVTLCDTLDVESIMEGLLDRFPTMALMFR